MSVVAKYLQKRDMTSLSTMSKRRRWRCIGHIMRNMEEPLPRTAVNRPQWVKTGRRGNVQQRNTDKTKDRLGGRDSQEDDKGSIKV